MQKETLLNGPLQNCGTTTASGSREHGVILSTALRDPQGNFYRREAPPLSLIHASAVLRFQGAPVRIVDLHHENQNAAELAEIARKSRPLLWGITFDVTDRFQAFQTAEIIKGACPETAVVAGGIFSSYCYREIMEDVRAIDVVVRGDGEAVLPELLARAGTRDFSEIPGVSWRCNGEIKHNTDSEPITDLESLPDPAYDLIEHSPYITEFGGYGLNTRRYPGELAKTPTAHLIFSRGCPFDCIFCSSNRQGFGRYRIISPEKAVRQVERFYRKGFRNFIFWDDHLTMKKAWFRQFHELIRQKQMKFFCKLSSRVDAIDEEVVGRMREMGCIKVTLGIEYGEDRMLGFIRKHTTTERIRAVYRMLRQNDIIVGAGMLTNFPTESYSSVHKSFVFFKGLEAEGFPSHFFPEPVQVHPGTLLDLEYWSRKHPGFRWTRPFFNKYNLFMRATPYIPLWQNVPTWLVLGYTIMAAMRTRKLGTVEMAVLNCLIRPDRIYLGFRDRFLLRALTAIYLALGLLFSPLIVKDFGGRIWALHRKHRGNLVTNIRRALGFSPG